MLVTVQWIEKNYIKFNDEYFGGRLPMIKFKVSRAKHTWGYASYIRDYRNSTIIPECITISNYYDSPEEVKMTTLLHEMIHIEDYTFHPEHYMRNGRKITGHVYDAHGWWFKEECKRLKKYGWDIEKYVTEEEKSVSTLSKRAKENLKNKKINALACVITSSTMAFVIKTDVGKITEVKKSINRIGERNWNIFLRGNIKTIKFYKVKSQSFAENRSCCTKLTGKRLSLKDFNNSYKKSICSTEYKIAA